MELVISIGQHDPESRSLWDWLMAEPALRGLVRIVEKPPADVLTVAPGPEDVAATVASVLVAWLRRRVGDVTVTVTRPDGVWVTVDATQVRDLDPTEVEELVDGLAHTLGRPTEDVE
jgi:hypothetical protein